MGIYKDSTNELLNKNHKRTGMKYCAKFKSIFKGWCGCSQVGIFRKSKEMFICEERLSKNLSKIIKDAKRGNHDGE